MPPGVKRGPTQRGGGGGGGGWGRGHLFYIERKALDSD